MAKPLTMNPTVRAILDVCKEADLREGDALPNRRIQHELIIKRRITGTEIAEAQELMAREGLLREEGNTAFLTREAIAAI